MTSEFVPQAVVSQPLGTNTAEAICVLNASGVIRFATPSVAAFYGYELADLIGRSALRFIAPDNTSATAERWNAFIRHPDSPSTQMFVTAVAAHGRRMPIHVSIWRLPGRDEFVLIHHVVEHLRERLDVLYSIMAAVSGTLESNAVLDSVLRELYRLIPCNFSTIYIRERHDTIRVRRWHDGQFEDFRTMNQEQLPGFETRRIMRETGRPLLINNCATDPRWVTRPGHRVIRSWLGAPLIHHGELMGEIDLDSTEPNSFTGEDAELVLALASQVAAVLHNVRQFEDEQRRARRYRALSDVSQAISQLDLRSVLEVVYQKISGLMDASTFFIGLYDEETQQVRIVGARDYGQPVPDTVQHAQAGLVGSVLRTGQSVILHNSAETPLPDDAIVQGETPSSLLMFPLVAQNEVVGVISVQSYVPNAYSPDDVDTLATMAGAIATAVRNAQLYDQALEHLTVLETLHRMSLDLVVTQDPYAIAELITRTALNLFKLDEVRLYLCDDGPWEPKVWIGQATGRAQPPQIEVWEGGPPENLVRRVYETRQALVLHDSDQVSSLQSEFSTLWPVQAAAIYPIMRSDYPFAVLVLLCSQPHFFRRDTLRALELLCMQSATAFENARYTVTLRRQLGEVTALQDLARKVSSSYTLSDIFDVVVQTLQDVYQCRGAWIALVDEEAGEVALKASVGIEPQYVERARFKIGEYGVGQVIESGQPLHVTDTRNTPHFRVVDPGVRSLLIVPLTVRGRVIGALGIDGAVPNAFSQEHERVLNIAGGQIAAAIETINLLQETRARADQLAVANASLQAQDDLRRELVYQVSHDLRSPLQIIYGYADMMYNGDLGPVTETQTAALDLMLKRTRCIERLTLDIMAAKPISHDMLELAPINLNELCRQAVVGAQMLYQQEGFTFVADLVPDWLPVEADYNRLSRVFDNLIGNAVKFSPDGGVITVRSVSEPDTRRALVSVSDHGIGIAADQVPYVFERFFRGDRKRFDGSGLGLYLVQQIVEAHRGQVWVTSQPGAGSTFTFALPLIEE